MATSIPTGDVASENVGHANSSATPEALAQEIARLNLELISEREGRFRALADFEKYQRRMRQERVVAEQAGRREILLALLDVLDDVDRGLLHAVEGPDALLEWLELIQRRFSEVLQSSGVAPFESEGQLFDPSLHEAMVTIDGDGNEVGTVYAEHRRGYLLNGEVLRPARVAVLR